MSTLGDIASNGAPVLVAVVAIGVSAWQQSRSREFDRAERQKDRENDRSMREQAERHERDMSELDYRRALVDDVNAALEDASSAVAQLISRMWVHGRCDDATVTEASTALTGLRIAVARSCLRFGPDHEAVGYVTRAYEATLLAHSIGVVSAVVDEDAASDGIRARVTRASRDLHAAIKAYVETVGREIGATTVATADPAEQDTDSQHSPEVGWPAA